MFHTKWLLASAILALGTMGLAGCGEDGNGEDVECTPETVAEDCEDTELCVEDTLQAGGTGFVCRQDCAGGEACGAGFECNNQQFCAFVPTTCTSDADCGEGQTCNTATGECESPTACTTDTDCPTGQTCNTETGLCEIPDTSCADTSDCYDSTAYCATVSGNQQCVSIACPSEFNDCNACDVGPSLDSNGPLIFDIRNDGCVRADTGANIQCLSDAPFACDWSFATFDPDGDLSDANTAVTIYTSRGSDATPFGVNEFEDEGIRRIGFVTCETSDTDDSFFDGVSYEDSAGNSSNTLCMP